MAFNKFRIQDYEHICKTIKNSKYETFSLQNYFEEQPEKNFIIIRHDVDYNICDAFKIAAIEERYGINSTFFIRLNNKSTYKKIKQLSNKASEIGLHYDALAKTNCNIKKALAIFKDQLKFLNSIVEVRTVSAHGSSMNRNRNTELLKYFKMDHFNIIGDAMASIDFEKIPYYSDAGRTWNLEKNKLNDSPDKLTKNYKYINKSNELCSLITNKYYPAIYLSSHPELWAKNLHENIFKEIKFGSIRFLVKRCIKYCKWK